MRRILSSTHVLQVGDVSSVEGTMVFSGLRLGCRFRQPQLIGRLRCQEPCDLNAAGQGLIDIGIQSVVPLCAGSEGLAPEAFTSCSSSPPRPTAATSLPLCSTWSI